MKFRRRDRLPPEVRTALDLRPGERVLAVARDAQDGWVVATQRALWAGGPRVAWTEVSTARWDDEALRLELALVPAADGGQVPPGGAAAPGVLRLALAVPGRVPETVHERVMASIVLSRHFPAAGGGFRVVARRDPDGPDLLWQLVPDEGTDLAHPDVRRHAEAALASSRAELA